MTDEEAEHVDTRRIAIWGESLSARLSLVAAAVEPLVAAVILVTFPCGRRVEDWSLEAHAFARRDSSETEAAPRYGPMPAVAESLLEESLEERARRHERVASDMSAASATSTACLEV